MSTEVKKPTLVTVVLRNARGDQIASKTVGLQGIAQIGVIQHRGVLYSFKCMGGSKSSPVAVYVEAGKLKTLSQLT